MLNRPNDLTDIELHAELTPPAADCCVRPPSMIHIDKTGNVIGSFDAPQGHGMDVDSKGFVYIGQDTVRKYDPKTGKVVAEIARVARDRRWRTLAPEVAARRRASRPRRPGPRFWLPARTAERGSSGPKAAARGSRAPGVPREVSRRPRR